MIYATRNPLTSWTFRLFLYYWIHPLCDFWNPATHWPSVEHSEHSYIIDIVHPIYYFYHPTMHWPVEHSDDFYIIAFIPHMISVTLQPIDRWHIRRHLYICIRSLSDLCNPATHWTSFEHSDHFYIIDFIHASMLFLSPCHSLTSWTFIWLLYYCLLVSLILFYNPLASWTFRWLLCYCFHPWYMIYVTL